MLASEELVGRLVRLRASALKLGAADSQIKNQVLTEIASALTARKAEILSANALDLSKIDPSKTAPAFIDRLTLNAERIDQMAESLKAVADLADPVGEVVEARILENGLKTTRVRAPLGVIFMIFEARPNVAIEAFSLGFKAGNAMILRGGSESRQTAQVLYAMLGDALKVFGTDLPFWGISDPDRAIVDALLQKDALIDVVVPRGGAGLIDHVTRTSKIPVIKNDRGMCHVYAHADADLKMACDIVINAKTQRPGVCNSMETLLVHESIAAQLIPALYDRMNQASPGGQVEWFACARAQALLRGKAKVTLADASAWDTEYLDLKMNCRVVDSLEEALNHIALHGSRHSEAIITADLSTARIFQSSIDAAAVYWNASTRFTDGFELGLGGELGISTQKLHVRGPVGLKELTSLRWIIDGHGQIRRSK